MKNKAKPEKYRLTTSKGDQVNKPATISKGVLKETVHTRPKIKNTTINTVDDQEPISRRTRSIKSNQTGNILKKTSEPISQRTKSKNFEQKYTTPTHSRALATHMLTNMENSVLEHETGKKLNYGQLRKNPRPQETWKTSFSNEMGRLCQGVGTSPNGKGKRIEITNTIFAIKFENIQKDRLNEICYTSVVCEVRPGKKDPNRTRITIC